MHTIKPQHPFEITQASDALSIKTGKDNYITGKGTDSNILFNIMNYGGIIINGSLSKDLRKNAPAELITKGQLEFMKKEIDKQKNGEGMPGPDHDDYWDPFNSGKHVWTIEENN